MKPKKPIDIVEQFVGIFGHNIDKHYYKIDPEYKEMVLQLLRDRISEEIFDCIELLDEKNVEYSIKNQILSGENSIDLF